MRRQKIDGINLIPFIDIMLVLLVIVLTSATFIAQGKIPISLPKSDSAEQIKSDEKEVQITIDSNGGYFLDKMPMNLEQIKQEISKMSDDQPILLRGDSKSYFEQFIALIGILNQSGKKNVDIQVQQQ